MLCFEDAVCGGVEESLTWMVKDEVPLPVGVPEMVPLALSVSPAGRVPAEILQV